MSPTCMRWLLLKTPRLEATKAFYEHVGIGFTTEQHAGGPLHYSAEVEGVLVEVFPAQASSPAAQGTDVGFRVPDVDAAVRRLRESGARVLTPPGPSSSGYRAVVEDPDGRRVVLWASGG